jgi:O-antigen/teichoic acid export membrane protein
MMNIPDFLKPIKESEYFKNIFLLFTGSTIVQAIPFVTLPILSRIYEPSEYGVLGIFMMIIVIGASLLTLQYENAIIISPTHTRVKIAVGALLYFTFGMFVVLCALFLGLRDFILKFFSIGGWYYFVPVITLITTCNNILMVYANRLKLYRVMTYNRLMVALLVPSVSILTGLFLKGVNGLMIGFFVGTVCSLLFIATYFFILKKLRLKFSKRLTKIFLKKYKGYFQWSFPAEFMNLLSSNLPIMMLSAYSNVTSVGLYSQGQRVLVMPTQVMSSATGEVFRQKATEDYNKEGSCRKVFMQTFKGLFLIALPTFTILFFFAEDLMTFFLGEKWANAGKYTSILSIMFFFKFVVSPLTYTVVISHRLHLGLIMDILLLVSSLISFSIGLLYFQSTYIAITIYSLVYSALYLVTFYMAYSCSVNPDFNPPHENLNN